MFAGITKLSNEINLVGLNELPKKQINFIKDEIIEINPENNFIKTKSENISFDFLIISMGAVLAPEKIPGLVENGFNLYDHNQLDKIHQKLNKIENGKITEAQFFYSPIEATPFLFDLYKSKKSLEEELFV